MRRIIICLSMILTFSVAQGQKTVKQLEQERAQTLEQLEETKKMLNQTKKNETATLGKLKIINEDIRTRQNLISGLNTEITVLDKQMRTLNEEKKRLQTQLDSLKADYAHLVRETHFAHIQHQPLLFVLSAKDWQQMYRRIRYMQEFADYRKQQVKAIEETQAQIAIKNDLLEANKSSKKEVLQVQKREQNNLTRDKKKQQSMLNQLKKKEKELVAQQKKQQKKADELNKKIDRLIQEEIQKSKKLTKEQELVGGNFAANKGKLPWPAKGFISGHFGTHAHPTLKHVKVNNKGIYIQTTQGTDAQAIYDGTVTTIFVLDGKNVVIVRHGNYYSVYSNLTKLYVKTGDNVTTKQKLGRIYTNPDEDNTTEIFFQLRKGTDLLNPAEWLVK